MYRLILRLAGAALALGACAMPAAQTSGWQTWDFGAFRLDAPSGMQSVAGGKDSLAGALTDGGLRIDYDYGLYSDPLPARADARNFESREGMVDALAARFVRFELTSSDGRAQSCSGVHVPSVSNTTMGALRFTALACADDASRLEVMPAVFSSLRFKSRPN